MNHSDNLPVAERLPAGLWAVEVFCRLAKLPHVVFFDSASSEGKLNRFSFIAADPFQWITKPADASDALAVSRSALEQYPTLPRTDLPPFQGGAAGLFGYELARSFE